MEMKIKLLYNNCEFAINLQVTKGVVPINYGFLHITFVAYEIKF